VLRVFRSGNIIAFEATVGVVLYYVTLLDYVYVVRMYFWGSLTGG